MAQARKAKPKADTIRTTLTIERSLWGKVYALSLEDHSDMNTVVVEAVRQYVGGRS